MKDYWNEAALDPDVDVKYICDLPAEDCLLDIGILKGKVLEIGCGVGRLMRDGWYGIDIAENMLTIARQRKPNCHFKLCDGAIPYTDEMFDNVYCYLVFQHLKEPAIRRYIHEAYRVLKPYGTFTFQFIQGSESEPLSNHYPLDLMHELLDDAGFAYSTAYKSRAHKQWTMVEAFK